MRKTVFQPAIMSTLVAAFAHVAQANELTLDVYLTQVKQQNFAVRAALESSAGALERANESAIPISPVMFSSAQFSSDAKIPLVPFFTYDKVIANSYAIGLSQQTKFGLQAKLSYNLNYFSYVNPSIPMTSPQFWESRPAIELSQPLWNNGLGRATRATSELLEAQALASRYISRFQARATLVEAESTYWRLALARQTVAVQKNAIERARKLYEWSARRARLQLADKADEFQAKAALEVRSLELQAAQDEEKEATRIFNSLRNINSDQIMEETTAVSLNLPDPATLTLPIRDDVKAAKQSERAALANSTVAYERGLPTLDVFGALTFNGRQKDFGDAIGDTLPANRPTQAIGIRFSVPLDFGASSSARDGWLKEKSAAELFYQRKIFEQEQTWKALNEKLAEAKKRLNLARAIESAQETKLVNERNRLERGRTTTYQVLLFEQDYSQAQLLRLRNQVEVLNLFAQTKLFNGDEL